MRVTSIRIRVAMLHIAHNVLLLFRWKLHWKMQEIELIFISINMVLSDIEGRKSNKVQDSSCYCCLLLLRWMYCIGYTRQSTTRVSLFFPFFITQLESTTISGLKWKCVFLEAYECSSHHHHRSLIECECENVQCLRRRITLFVSQWCDKYLLHCIMLSKKGTMLLICGWSG